MERAALEEEEERLIQLIGASGARKGPGRTAQRIEDERVWMERLRKVQSKLSRKNRSMYGPQPRNRPAHDKAETENEEKLYIALQPFFQKLLNRKDVTHHVKTEFQVAMEDLINGTFNSYCWTAVDNERKNIFKEILIDILDERNEEWEDSMFERPPNVASDAFVPPMFVQRKPTSGPPKFFIL